MYPGMPSPWLMPPYSGALGGYGNPYLGGYGSQLYNPYLYSSPLEAYTGQYLNPYAGYGGYPIPPYSIY